MDDSCSTLMNCWERKARMAKYLVLPKQRLKPAQADQIIKDLFLLCCERGLGHECAVVLQNNGITVKVEDDGNPA